MIPDPVIVGAIGAFVLLGWVLVVMWLWEGIESRAARATDEPKGHATLDLPQGEH